MYFYMHKSVFFGEIIQIRLIPFKRRLNGLNSKQRVTDRLTFTVYENIV